MESKIENEIRILIEKYVKSIDEADIALANGLWLDSAHITFPDLECYAHGLEEIKQDLYRKQMDEAFSVRKLSVKDLSVRLYGSTAIAEFAWHFEARRREDGSSFESNGREMHVYWQNDPDKWVLVHVFACCTDSLAGGSTTSD